MRTIAARAVFSSALSPLSALRNTRSRVNFCRLCFFALSRAPQDQLGNTMNREVGTPENLGVKQDHLGSITTWLTSCYTKPLWWRFSFGVGAVLIGAALRMAFSDALGGRLAYLTFYPVVEAAAVLGGFVSGVVATIISILLAHLWIAPLGGRSDWIGLSVFTTSCIVVSTITEALHRAWLRTNDLKARANEDDRVHVVCERLQLAFSAGSIGAWDLDLLTGEIEASPETREIFGFSSASIVTRKLVASLIQPEDLPAVRTAFKRALNPANGGRYQAEYRIRRASDGEERWISASAQAVFCKEQPSRLIGVCRDITKEKSVEALFREKAHLAEQLSSVAASVPGVICTFRQSADGSQTFPYASSNFQEIYGLAIDSVRYDAGPLFQRIHPEDRNHIDASRTESARTGALWHDQFRYEHPLKGEIWLEGQSLPVIGANGEIDWHGYVQDVTARKKSEDELRASEARSRAFFESGLIGVIYWNVNGSITEANNKFLEMIGYSREDLNDGCVNWFSITPREHISRDEAALSQMRSTGANAIPFEKEFIRRDGSRLPVLIGGALLDKANGDGVAFVLDITERKRAELQLRQLHADRMNALKNLADVLAHEINQPLTATVAYVKAVRRLLEKKPEERSVNISETLEKAAAETVRAGEILNRLREFIAQGEPKTIVSSLNQLIQNGCVGAIGSAKEPKDILELQLNATRDNVLVDETQIGQVLAELIRTASDGAKHNPMRKVMIRTSNDENNARVDITVGALESAQPACDSPAISKHAMGLGLSISRAIVEAHRGKLWTSSDPQGATIFSFTLPLAEKVADLN